ncbi:hypothetical protein MRB53_021450 [Persea americana]|uniref:Uncharacterized protein n=1 Tax=Persea americana TaxID=3435 RepID=A0ACC2L458_PERAE|nr:hypothetical protein MRB53_021450 [Persea americana]
MAFQESFRSLLLVASIFFPICNSIDTITPNQSLKDGETLISVGEKFVLGFFSPGNSSTNRYVGIWYNKIPDQTIVWTANRENPVKNSSGVLIIKGGNLVLVDGGHSNNSTLWSTNVSTAANYSSATLTDSGNLALTDDHQRVLWESFDYPTNTWLPGMKVGLDRRTGLSRFLTSWKSTTDPAPGEFSFAVDPTGVPQYVLRLGSDRIWGSGPWNGQRLSGVPGMNRDNSYSWSYVANDDEIYLTYDSNHSLTNFVLDNSGLFGRLIWNDGKRSWNLMSESTRDRCDRYAYCGAYGSCDSNRAVECECLRGFEPKTNSDWNLRDWSGGCVRKRLLDCDGKGDGFLRLANVKVPDTSRSWVEPGLSLDGCKEECLKNCSCTAYASADIREGGHGCLMWDGDLVDLRVYSDGGQDIYTRVAASELDGSAIKYSRGLQGKKKLLVTLLTIIAGLLLFVLCGYCWWRKAKGCEMNERHDNVLNDNDIEDNEPRVSRAIRIRLGLIPEKRDHLALLSRNTVANRRSLIKPVGHDLPLPISPSPPSPGVLLLPRSPSQPSPDAAIVRRRPSGIVGEATAADCRRERKKNQTILTQTITLRPSLHDRRRRCSVAVPSSPPRSPATCPPSPLKKKTVTWATALF